MFNSTSAPRIPPPSLCPRCLHGPLGSCGCYANQTPDINELALSVYCRTCSAAPGTPCSDFAGHDFYKPHMARLRLFAIDG